MSAAFEINRLHLSALAFFTASGSPSINVLSIAAIAVSKVTWGMSESTNGVESATYFASLGRFEEVIHEV